jgi:8-oxo-dGTP pyrophosphatase MutT (NUDIX family)
LSQDRLEAVVAAIEAVEPVDAQEAAAKQEILLQVRSLDSPFSEDASATHLTASGFIVGARGTVLHRHRKLGIWVQPGGHVDDGERAEEAALREAREETGLLVAHPPEGPLLLHVDVHDGPHGHVHLDLRFVLLAPSDDPHPGAGESQEVRWLTFPEAREIADPSLSGALDKVEQAWRDHEASWREKVEEMAAEERPEP